MLSPTRLDSALADPAISSLSDADAAAALSVPIYTPRAARVTVTTLAAATVWGFAKAAAAEAAFQAAADSGAASARTLLSILRGDGFDATDPQTAALAPAFVAMSGGAISSADARLALNTISYRCGDVVQASDVTASRARVVRRVLLDKITAVGASLINDYLPPLIDTSITAPTKASVIARLDSMLSAAGVA